MPGQGDRIQNDRAWRREVRNAVIQQDLYEAPPEEECFVDASEMWLSSDHQLYIVLYWHDSRLVRFFMAWQALDRDGAWTEKYSVCTKHGHLHEHTTGHHQPNDRRDIKPLYSQADVQESHDEAYERVHNRYIQATGGPS